MRVFERPVAVAVATLVGMSLSAQTARADIVLIGTGGINSTYDALMGVAKQTIANDFAAIYDPESGTAFAVSLDLANALAGTSSSGGGAMPSSPSATNYAFTITKQADLGDYFVVFFTRTSTPPVVAAQSASVSPDVSGPPVTKALTAPVVNAAAAPVATALTTPVTVNPEPATLMLFGTGLVGVAGIARRRRRPS